MTPDTWIHVGILIASLALPALGWVFSAGRMREQIRELAEWKTRHESEAKEGYGRLSILEGGDTSVVHRLERAIEQVTQTVQANAVQIGEVNGQVQALAQTVSMLVQRGLTVQDRV